MLLFQLKHWLAGFVLQSDYMMKKFLPGWDFFFPLAAHAAVQGVGASIIVGIYDLGAMWWAGLLTFVLHFAMDRLKAGPKYMGRWKMLGGPQFATATDEQRLHNKYFWAAFGFNQMWHHCTGFLVIWLLLF